ncbi:SusC/RagA family TonB-linked outer membrane protein [Pedobacter aquatilis]|uniref:SusC/RagA family TonB-linked outer membrane protein n=1 Tax=Pedobacter aquatilis TaxID=351343 RepID=UPI00292CFD52|nr:SusC/RagA family TonB-linked outer membrane protein [Pedobacter aquatilis]
MKKKYTFISLKSILGLLCMFPALVYGQKKDSIAIDSSIIKKFDSGTFLNAEVGSWHGVIKKANLVGGASAIYAEEINTTPVANISNTLAGRLTGLFTLQSSARTGYDATSLTLRGQTPLIVVDGVVRDFTSFNPADVESITVLKDALSTSMYGMRSAGGIVYITTKKRSAYLPLSINFSAEYGKLQNLFVPNFITAGAYARIYNEAQKNTNPNSVPLYSDALISAYDNNSNNPFLQPNNNWYDLVYKKNSAQKRYNLGIAGNSKAFKYYGSLEHFASDGNFVTDSKNTYNTNNYYKRYALRTNAEINFNDDISLSLKIFGSIENNNQPGGAISASNLSLTAATGIMNSIYATSPLAYAVKNPDGSYGGTAAITNNILASTINSGYILTTGRTLTSDVGLKYKLDDIAQGLWAQASLSINNYYNESILKTKTYSISYPTVNGNTVTYTKSGVDGNVGLNTGSSIVVNQVKQTYYNFMLGYQKDFNAHHLDLLATYNGDNTNVVISQLNNIFKTAGLSLRYNYDGKYLAEFSNAYSSFNKYSSDNRWLYLPAAGLGWIVSKENWFSPSFINYFKIRSTFGLTASANSSDYFSYIQRYSLSGTGYVFGTGPTAVSGATEGSLAATGVGAAKANKFELGLDAAFVKNKLNFGLTYYNNKYYDLLIFRPYTSSILGNAYPAQNLGSKRYSGIEGTVDFTGKTGNFGYKLGLNLSAQKTRVLDAAEQNLPNSYMYTAGQAEGVFGYEAIGFYKNGENETNTPTLLGYSPLAGDIKYRDLNGDGVISELDRKRITTVKPFIFGGLSFAFNFKGFDLTGLFQGVTNRQVLLSTSAMLALNNNTGYVLDYTTENRWTPVNQENATLPRLTLGTNVNNSLSSTFWLRNADYLRLKNLELGYTFSKHISTKLRVQKLRFFVNSYNLFTWSKLDFDPESFVNGFSNQRVINGGVSLTL